MKKFLLPGIFAVIFLLSVWGYLSLRAPSNPPQPPTAERVTPPSLPSSYEYFWGDGCPHCATVAKFFDSWENKDKIQIDKKEVWENRENNNLMLERAKYCGIKPSDLGVPFLFTPDGKCFSGDQPIIEYLKSLAP